MALEVQNLYFRPNAQRTFTFSGDVVMYAVGISGFEFIYPDGSDHSVEELSLSVQAQQAGSSKAVTVTTTSALRNGSGDQMDESISSVRVCAIAWVGADPGNLTLYGPSAQIGSGQQSDPISLATNGLVASGGLAGFNLAYAGDSYDVRGISASASANANGNVGYINVNGDMWDASGNSASNPTASGLLIANPYTGSRKNPGIVLQTCKWQGGNPPAIQMGRPLSSVAFMITDFKVQYPDTDHYVLGISVGTPNLSISPDDNRQVVMDYLGAKMWNDDGSYQDDSQSHCSILVVGVPQL